MAVNFDLQRENIVTSNVQCAIKGQITEENYENYL